MRNGLKMSNKLLLLLLLLLQVIPLNLSNFAKKSGFRDFRRFHGKPRALGCWSV